VIAGGRVYLVGGAVRDELLGLPVKERDWVVVGATPAAMTAAGFRPVGKDFPVFLHPETGEEYALARTERKTGRGYHGFTFHADAHVSLEQDLQRRDLSINAMARGPDGTLVDPYGGRRDLRERRLRHISPAFAEDPVRVLRVARFAARYQSLGFSVAPETMGLMGDMVAAGEVDALVPERVWAETARALDESAPQAFIKVLRSCGALARVMPEVDRLFGVPQPTPYHPEVDTGVHLLMALEQAARQGLSNPARLAVLLHDLGKGLTPREEWPRHIGHERAGVAALESFCHRLRVPKRHRRLAVQVALHHTSVHRARELRPATVLRILETSGTLRDEGLLEEFLGACEADARGRAGLQDRPYPQAELFRRARRVAAAVDARVFVDRGLSGSAIGTALHAARLAAVRDELNRIRETDRPPEPDGKG
jgi:tRNA nucleotidyltransferase (CCA-adding enzyme)